MRCIEDRLSRRLVGAVASAAAVLLLAAVAFAEDPDPAATQEAATPAADAQPQEVPHVMLTDPATGELIDVEDVAQEMRLQFRPGDINGVVLEADGVTPHAGVTLALKDVHTGTEVASTVTDEEGKFVLEGVPEGLYLVLLGNPGLAAVLSVTPEAQSELLTIVLAQTSSGTEAPAQWVATPLMAVGIGGALVVAPIVTWEIIDNNQDDDDDDESVISPTVP